MSFERRITLLALQCTRELRRILVKLAVWATKPKAGRAFLFHGDRKSEVAVAARLLLRATTATAAGRIREGWEGNLVGSFYFVRDKFFLVGWRNLRLRVAR
jgi:hypothetical protein